MKRIVFIPFLFFVLRSVGQNDRVSDPNNTNWLQTVNTISLNKKWALHLEYQWRRTDGFKNWQQSLVRLGANYKLNDNMGLHIGYAWAETFPYGDFPEHRLYEQINFVQLVKRWTFTHRFRIEQRWLGRVKAGTDREIEDWSFLHRFRYQFRAMHPLRKGNDKILYIAVADEIFIGAGKDLGTNIFDQNRIFLLLGYKFSKRLSVEAGYFNQSLQQGRRINNNTIIQLNNGIVLSSFFSL